MAKNSKKQIALVYQAGIANVFECAKVSAEPYDRHAKRLMQADFAACENFASGMRAARLVVFTLHCNEAGDIQDSRWSWNLDEAPFRESFSPVGLGTF